ncbi:glutathione S-transferase family protein [Grimontia marina]|uniref:Glutathione S-transferase GST-6.0 n=1 Tax=Grimontia marina TaxID=646534 RepID=A0A128FHK9_9GAMM|nr:glutathione S-transferase family protein [Grimontia marina]CZF86279.1 Glutathione S-transferase GST-6.0 [Grimontia marina]
MYKLFYYPRNASWAPHMLMVEMGLRHELILVDRKSNAQKSESYLKLNPTGRIPVLVDDELVIHESAAIGLHLCENHPESGLIPDMGSLERPIFFQWLFYLTSSLQSELMVYFYPQRHTENPDEAAAIKQAQEARVTDMFALIDCELEGKNFLVGHRISMCDFFLFMFAHWASDFDKPPLSFEHLGRYLRDLAKRNSVVTASELEGTNLDIYR